MKLTSKAIKENTFEDGYKKGINDMIHELSKMSLKVSTVKVPHTYMRAVGTHNIELAGQRLKKRFRKVEREDYEKAIEIVKQGCVSDDVCEWKSTQINNEWNPSCELNSSYNVFGVAWFKRCPYCGKKIKVVK